MTKTRNGQVLNGQAYLSIELKLKYNKIIIRLVVIKLDIEDRSVDKCINQYSWTSMSQTLSPKHLLFFKYLPSISRIHEYAKYSKFLNSSI